MLHLCGFDFMSSFTLLQKMASDTNDLEDSEVMYRDDDLDETFASQSQFEGQTHSLNVCFYFF